MIVVNSEICDGCGTCIEVCPTDALNLHHNLAFINQNICQGCAVCVDTCPQGAILIEEAISNKPDTVDLTPVDVNVISIPTDHPHSISWRDALGSAFIWTSREIVPRLANLTLSYLEQRMQPSQTNQNHPNGQRGRRHRRRRQRQAQ